MAAIQCLYNKATAVTANSTSWVTVATLAAATFTASKTYIIKGHAFSRMNSSSNEFRLRLAHGATPTVFTDASYACEPTSNTQETGFGWLFKFDMPGTTEDIVIQASVSATDTVTVEIGEVVAFNLTDNLTENTHWWFNEVTADYTTTSSMVAQASVTFTANGTDVYLVWGQGTYDPLTIADEIYTELNDSVAGVLVRLQEEPEDATNETRGRLMEQAYVPASGSHTVSVRFGHETDADTILSSRIFVWNLTATFAQNAYSADGSSVAISQTPTWDTTRTIAPTPTITGDWYVGGYSTWDTNSGNTADCAFRLQMNPTGAGLASNPAYTDSSPGIDSWDSQDQTPVNLFTVTQFNSGASRTINLDAQIITAPAAERILNRSLVAFSLERLAAGGTFPPVPERLPKKPHRLRR